MKKEGINLRCYHCGEDCGNSPVMFDEKSFCCQGCRTVYEILNESDACEYYNYEQYPGLKALRTETGNKFAFLDNEEIRKDLLEFSDSGISKVKFFIPSIHCSSCIWLLENLDRLHKGIVHATVHFTKKEAVITFRDDQISLRELAELLTAVNYEPRITLDDLERKNEKRINRKLLYQLGVAGFCFGNIMLFSFPEYLSAGDMAEAAIRKNFHWLNLGLSLPVILYAASGYFISAYKGLRKKIINIDVPIAIGMVALWTRSVFDILTGTGAGYMDSLAGLVFFLLIGKWYQEKTYKALSFERDYQSYFPVAVTILNDHGEESLIPLKKLKTGQRILVRNQELIPADAILLKGDAHIDYSFVSGESRPVNKQVREKIYAGGRQIGSSIELIVEKEVSQSYLTELWNEDMNSGSKDSRMKPVIDTVSRYFTLIIIMIALFAGISWYFIDPTRVMHAFTAVLIVACPCALALTLPFAFGSAMRIYGRNGFYLKKNDVVEILSGINTIVFDKTGTITGNDEFEVNTEHAHLNEEELSLVRSLVKQSTHPMSVALYRSLNGPSEHEVAGFREVMSGGISGLVNGKEIIIGSGKFVAGSNPGDMVEGSTVYISLDGSPRGYFIIKNRYRPGFEEVVGLLRNKYDLHVLSGDNDAEKPVLDKVFGTGRNLLFHQSPQDKLKYIRDLKKQGRKVLMVGDGLNDAGALKESDAGISIADDVYHFSPACDAILEARQFRRLPVFLDFPKRNMAIVKTSFVISFLYNIVGISFAAAGLLTPIIAAILMPVSSVTVVAFVTAATTITARRKGMQ